jgi:hypothetical protein
LDNNIATTASVGNRQHEEHPAHFEPRPARSDDVPTTQLSRDASARGMKKQAIATNPDLRPDMDLWKVLRLKRRSGSGGQRLSTLVSIRPGLMVKDVGVVRNEQAPSILAGPNAKVVFFAIPTGEDLLVEEADVIQHRSPQQHGETIDEA